MLPRGKRSRFALPEDEYKKLCLFIHKRDGFKCRVPHCGAREGLHAHHIIFRSHGGGDYSWNLITICNDCHEWIHTFRKGQGLIVLSLSGETEEINADEGVKFMFLNKWLPKNCRRKKQ